ncbi:fibroblast growth factor 23 [Neolamprologus brichardi]|uniref:Fibroblast growth factor 23-like n=1 Tax=Neolamprologus brichardi TaxID=32507 RepID=A0A3Q4MZI1_NEOBR|nr:fibroblast growth factor 23 [Neolamprologus brichardi]
MQLASFLVVLIAVHVSVPVDCRPRLQDSEQLAQHQQGRLNTATNADPSMGRFYSVLDGSMTHSIYSGFLVTLPVRTASSNFVSIFDLRRKRFICMDFKGKLYTSTQRDRADCLFQDIWLDLVSHHHVFYSTSGRRLLRLQAGHLRAAHGEPPEHYLALLRLLNPSVKRQRRSEEVNPSDPLRTEANPSRSGKDLRDADHVRPEQDQTGAVSKETIASCDDPLSVLQPNAPGSPVKTNIADQA